MRDSTFYRLTTDGVEIPSGLDDVYAGPVSAACWLIGGGPSLSELPCERIAASPSPKMAVNLAGTRLLRPTFWTSYDPTVRFHRSVYLDPGITKFVHRRRAMDLVPDSTYKVCECPNLYFFNRDGQRGFHHLLSPAHTGIVDWADSMMQAIDILYRLGFRTVFLAGCEMQVRLSVEQTERLAAAGVRRQRGELLQDLLRRGEEAGVDAEELDALPAGPHYHFQEQKTLRAAVNTDAHYFRISQSLRLSRRSLAMAGMELVSVTPESRLNDYFPYCTVEQACRRIARTVGDPRSEPVRGLYHQIEPRHPSGLGPMRDFKPHNWKAAPAAAEANAEVIVEQEGYEPPPAEDRDAARVRLREALENVAGGEPMVDEVG